MCQEIGKRDRLVHVSRIRPLALRRRLVGDFIPSLHAGFRVGRAYDRAFGDEGVDFEDSKLGCFLYEPVKSVAFGNCLRHHEPAARWRGARQFADKLEFDRIGGDRRNPAFPLFAWNQDLHGGPDAKPQHASQFFSRRTIKHQFAVCERSVAEKESWSSIAHAKKSVRKGSNPVTPAGL